MADPPGGSDRPAGYLGISRRPTRREWRRAFIFFVGGIVVLTLMFFFIQPPRHRQPRPGGNARLLRRRQHPGAGGGRGQPYVVEFFAAGCPHCQQVAAQLCNEKVPVFTVDAAKESAATISAFRHQYASGCTYPMLLDPNLTAVTAYAVSAVPTVCLVKLGRIVFAGAGLDGISALPTAVQKALSG